jgi:hypothetical protein
MRKNEEERRRKRNNEEEGRREKGEVRRGGRTNLENMGKSKVNPF